VLLVEAASGREGKHIDAGKLAVGAQHDELLDCRHGLGIGHLTERRE
jgi:hypothetical protein